MSGINQYLGSLFNLKGKTALVTGGASGIGYMITHALVSAGANVIIASRKLEACQQAADSLADLAGECTALSADLSTEKGVKSLAAEVISRDEPLHILVNNSGKTWGAAYGDFPWDAWDSVMSVNVTGLYTLTEQLTPLLSASASASDPARVINVGSVVGSLPHGNHSYSYAASKAAVHHLTRILSNELAAHRVTVNAIAPGPFPSRMMAHITNQEKGISALNEMVPLNRVGEPRDIAGVIMCLCGAGGAYMSGAIIPLDGGMVAERSEPLSPEILV
jgi:NAD(P)-dependent dehydrogenase (short-subunit alcohol dehydrogenase family)